MHCEGVQQDAFVGGLAEKGCDVAEKRCCVGPNGGLRVHLQEEGFAQTQKSNTDHDKHLK